MAICSFEISTFGLHVVMMLVANGVATFDFAFTGTEANPVVVYAINMSDAAGTSPIIVDASTCSGTDNHLPTTVAVYSGDYPPFATALYGGDMASGATMV